MKVAVVHQDVFITIEKPIRLIIEPWANEYILDKSGEFTVRFEGTSQDMPEIEEGEGVLLVFAPPESIYTLISSEDIVIGGSDICLPAMPSGMSTKDFMGMVGLRDTSDFS
ncbi:hypothetical protein GCM10017783_08880 [Deinococcus piscis]|uniref:Cyclophilin TM1367-like domain-containing protein n=1 Tax=Deinococcus piscis TaxID=394230 RepID=A0ABQ3K451_9DEIO|nr:hypothetical protein [Deinococcus piscis]GHF99061.1 hypothetical protein GCM10017783_08880 [Deinococcus piscis]